MRPQAKALCNVSNESVHILYLVPEKIGAEVFAELWNVMLEENGEHKMVRESNKLASSLMCVGENSSK